MKSVKLEGVLTLLDEDKLVAIVYHDEKSRHQVFYKVEEMGAEDIQEIMNI